MYETTKYAKFSSKTDYLEVSQSVRAFIERILDSVQLRVFIHKRSPLIQEIKHLNSSLNFEKVLDHICCLSAEIINYFEDNLMTSSTLETENLNSSYRKYKIN